MEGLILKLKLQYFDHLMRRANSFEKTLRLGKIEDKRATENEMVDGIIDSMDMSQSKLQKIMKDKEVWCAIVHGVAKSLT